MPAGFLFAATNGKPATQDGLARVQTVTATEDHSARKASKSARGKASKTASKPKASSQANGGKKPTGRPSSYTEEIAEELCERIASGRSLRSVCDDEDMPHHKTVMRWDRDIEAFGARYARARHERGMYYGDKITETIDGVMAGRITPDQARIALDGYKWISARLAAKVYGDKQEVSVNHTVKIAEEHAAALIELSRRKREADTQMIDVTPDASLNKGMHSESKQQVIELLPKIDTGSEDGEG